MWKVHIDSTFFSVSVLKQYPWGTIATNGRAHKTWGTQPILAYSFMKPDKA